MLKSDFHVHTEYSLDCNTPLPKVISRCLDIGINCIAIADHGTIAGALKMQKLAPFTVIVAEEILTTHGEIMGMFLQEEIPGGLSVEQTIARIRDQNGLVCIPHPFDRLRYSALDSDIVEELAEQIDVIEVFNARSLLANLSNKAQLLAEKYGIRQSAGSDAHTAGEIGNAYIEMPEFKGRDDFLPALAKGKVVGHRTNPMIHFASVWSRLKGSLKKDNDDV